MAQGMSFGGGGGGGINVTITGPVYGEPAAFAKFVFDELQNAQRGGRIPRNQVDFG